MCVAAGLTEAHAIKAGTACSTAGARCGGRRPDPLTHAALPGGTHAQQGDDASAAGGILRNIGLRRQAQQLAHCPCKPAKYTWQANPHEPPKSSSPSGAHLLDELDRAVRAQQQLVKPRRHLQRRDRGPQRCLSCDAGFSSFCPSFHAFSRQHRWPSCMSSSTDKSGTPLPLVEHTHLYMCPPAHTCRYT